MCTMVSILKQQLCREKMNKIVKKSGSCFYHVCFEVDNIDESVNDLRNSGYLLRHKPVKAKAFGGRKIAWMYHRDIGLVELLEKA